MWHASAVLRLGKGEFFKRRRLSINKKYNKKVQKISWGFKK
ncbi:hypothetical protein AAJ76_2000018206 [Vairimorpha ceranae]|uniref:Uncharacterized protein n=1 Tax=Vairimorpha ceranae TaxID=40302 RepID=A0A0F9WFF7_9MICR|nr:hypothetical protein AAJ76_2000018206 [Vairimorpha ceranae]KKO75465.1 hypothetical protein AAJ76_2000018206 [Vairimorpha ceranae]